MFITPMDRISGIMPVTGTKNLGNTENVLPFKDFLDTAISNVIKTDNQVKQDVNELVTGAVDNTHALSIATTDAQLAISMLIQLRNRGMDAYNEIMRINL